MPRSLLPGQQLGQICRKIDFKLSSLLLQLQSASICPGVTGTTRICDVQVSRCVSKPAPSCSCCAPSACVHKVYWKLHVP